MDNGESINALMQYAVNIFVFFFQQSNGSNITES